MTLVYMSCQKRIYLFGDYSCLNHVSEATNWWVYILYKRKKLANWENYCYNYILSKETKTNIVLHTNARQISRPGLMTSSSSLKCTWMLFLLRFRGFGWTSAMSDIATTLLLCAVLNSVKFCCRKAIQKLRVIKDGRWSPHLHETMWEWTKN